MLSSEKEKKKKKRVTWSFSVDWSASGKEDILFNERKGRRRVLTDRKRWDLF